VVVTEAGVAVNPRRPELKDRFKSAGLDAVGIALHALAERAAGGVQPLPVNRRDRVVGRWLNIGTGR